MAVAALGKLLVQRQLLPLTKGKEQSPSFIHFASAKRSYCGLGCEFAAHPPLKDKRPSVGLQRSLVKTGSALCRAAEPQCVQGCALP